MIPNGADLDNYTTPGNYYSSGAVALIHSPYDSAVIPVLKVEASIGVANPAYVRQTIRRYNDGIIHSRFRTGDGWTDWIDLGFGPSIRRNSTDIINLGSRVGTAESNITNLTGRVSTNESDITGLGTRVGALESNLTYVNYTVSTTTESSAGIYYADFATNEATYGELIGCYIYDAQSNRKCTVQKISQTGCRVYSGVSGTSVTVRCLYKKA